MIIIGVDAHKHLHYATAIDDSGRELSQWSGPNSRAGWEELYHWVCGIGEIRRWGIEGAWNYGRGLAQFLVGCSEEVYDVNPRWTAQGRRYAHKRGKNDRLDAHAVALFILRELATLTPVQGEDESAVLDLLVSEREGTLAEATRLRNQIHGLLLQINPEYKAHLPNMRSSAARKRLRSFQIASESRLDQERAVAVRRLAQRLCLALDQAKDLEEQIKGRALKKFAPLTQLCGINLLTAGALAGILGPGCRFRTDAQLAAYAGVAPLEASSAGLIRHRLNRGGNRRLNAILYRIVLTQARYRSPTRAYLDRRMAEGKTLREARRALKRYVIRAVWRLWLLCQNPPAGAATQTSSPSY